MSVFVNLLLLFLLCSVKFVVGVPATYLAYRFNFFELTLFSSLAGISGVLVFSFLGDALSILWSKFRLRFFRVSHPKVKKRFTRGNRIYVSIIRRYGLFGLAFITPTIISIPVGSILAGRLFPNKRLVLIYLSGSVVLWSMTLSAVLSLF
jgi:hypothetical protein